MQLTKLQNQFQDRFRDYKFIGDGQFAKVYQARDQNNKLVAIKVIDISTMDKAIIPYMMNEIEHMKKARDNPNIVQYYDDVKTADTLYVIMEHCPLDVERLWKRYFPQQIPEDLAVYIMRQIVNGISYLHQQKIIHRDIKLENIAVGLSEEQLRELDQKKNIKVLYQVQYKMIDFGLAKQLKDFNSLTRTWAGTELNMAPEILEELPYGVQADMYSLGVCMFQLITGKYPYFDRMNINPLKVLIKAQNADFSKFQNQTLKNLIERMLKYDPNERIQWTDLANHEFFRFQSDAEIQPIDHDLQQGLARYNKSVVNQQFEPIKVVSVIKPPPRSPSPKQPENQQQQQNLPQQVQFSNPSTQSQIRQKELTPITTVQQYDPEHSEKTKIKQFYSDRNKYISITRTARLLEETVAVIKQTQYKFMTMEMKFSMYQTYLLQVAKMCQVRLRQEMQSCSTALQRFQNFIELKKLVEQESVQFMDIKDAKGSGMLSSIKKVLQQGIDCLPLQDANFREQYDQINVELFKILEKGINDTAYKEYKSGQIPTNLEKQAQCKMYLSMIYVARLRPIFVRAQNPIDHVQEAMWLEKAESSPDILAEKLTSILEEYQLTYT